MKRTFRHVLARLRERLGHMTQKELAAYAGTSTWSVQAIELGKLKLSQGLAFRISRAMGVDFTWLMENDLSKPPINQSNEPYSEEDLIRAQNRDAKPTWFSLTNGKMQLTQAYYYLHLIWEQAAKDPDELSFFLFRVKQFLEGEYRQNPELGHSIIPRDPHVETVYHKDTGKFEEVAVFKYPSLVAPTFRSFEVVERDVYECKELFKKRIESKKHIDSLVSNSEQENSPQPIIEAIAKPRENPSIPATKAVTAKRSKAQAKVRRASK